MSYALHHNAGVETLGAGNIPQAREHLELAKNSVPAADPRVSEIAGVASAHR